MKDMINICNNKSPIHMVPKVIIILMLIVMSATISVNAQNAKSYMLIESVGQNQNGFYPGPNTGKRGCCAAWDENGNMALSDGTMWRLVRRNMDGSYYYIFAGTTGQYPMMPGTQYTEALVSADRTMIKVASQFGMMGFAIPIIDTYGYIGEGCEPFNNYMNGD